MCMHLTQAPLAGRIRALDVHARIDGGGRAQPVLYVVDDDAGVMHALRDDLSRRFGQDFRVIGAVSATAGLAALRELADAKEPVALLIADHKMCEMPGVGFLARAHEMHPLAKRVLLVERDYSVRSPLVQAMTLMIRHDGYTIVEPAPAQVVQAIGGSTRTDVDECDVVIVGAGPAGLTAAVYAASEGLQTVVLEETVSGGQAGSSPMIRNYPGFAYGISGHELTRRACEQAWIFGAHLVFSQPTTGLECAGGKRLVHLADGHQIAAKAVIVAPGIAWRRLGVPHLEARVGAGVFYGAAGSDMRAMEGRDVFVVGAGNSAGQTALHLARYARQVTILVRGDSLARSMSDYLVREIEATGNVTVCLQTEVTDGHGTDHLEALTVYQRLRNRAEQVPAAALFVLIGGEPRTRWLPRTIQLDRGYIMTGRDVVRDGAHRPPWPLDRAPLPLETSMPGVFAAGDARCRAIKRVASAVGDGASAVRLVQEYLAAGDAGDIR